MPEFIADEIDFSQYLKETDNQQKVKKASVFVEGAKEKLRHMASGKRTFLPWPKTNGNFEFRTGETTIWAGQNGHGKTDLTTQVALSLLGQGEKVCIASFELKPVTTIEKMTRMFSRENLFLEAYQNEEGFRIIDDQYDQFAEWTENKLWFYDQHGNSDPQTVYGLIKYCANEFGITHIFIDSLMKVVKGSDDYSAQKDFINTVFSIGQDYKIHIHIVHHLKKPANEAEKPDKHSTKGAGELTDIADNLFMVWRNKPKEEERKVGGNSKQNEPDTMLYCKKQRIYLGNDDGEPSIGLWRHKDAGNFVAQPGDSAQFFGNYPHVESM